MAPRFPLTSRVLPLILSGMLGCGGDLLLPDPPGGGDNVVLSKFDGDGQEGTVGEALPEPLVVQVLTARGLPAIEREVEFVFTDAAGVVSPARAVTNSDGQAFANWKLGTEPGAQTVAAQLVIGEDEVQIQEFTAEARPGAPDTISAKSPTSEAGRRGQKLARVVQVVDRFGNPVPEATVAWQVSVGEGTVSEAITQTKVEGTSTVEWTLGSRVGVQRLTVTVGSVTGSPVSFTALVLF
jgi:hypothetical protein